MIDRVVRALARLRVRAATPLSQGLSAPNARACLDAASTVLTSEALDRAVHRARPRTVALVAAWGVFTSPLEWVALLAAAGCRLLVKAPSRDSTFVAAMAEDFSAEDLPVAWTLARDLGSPERVVAFGTDETIAAVGARYARVAGYGHRFSVAVAAGSEAATARSIARDAALYDGRGCFAPAAVFAIGDADALGCALAEAMAQAERDLPRGDVDPALGPEWRRRVGLARVTGSVCESPAWAVPELPVRHFAPDALPRMLPIHAVASVDEVRRVLAPWNRWLSTCGTDLDPAAVDLTPFPRVCTLGTMQTPPFPRLHDGRPMLASVLG